jgi:hypothetical protein
MNTASRMESTGLRDKIQVSQDTADLLVAAGKSNGEAREEKVAGKGEMQTYWVAVGFEKSILAIATCQVQAMTNRVTAHRAETNPPIAKKDTASSGMSTSPIFKTGSTRDDTNAAPLEEENNNVVRQTSRGGERSFIFPL